MYLQQSTIFWIYELGCYVKLRKQKIAAKNLAIGMWIGWFESELVKKLNIALLVKNTLYTKYCDYCLTFVSWDLVRNGGFLLKLAFQFRMSNSCHKLLVSRFEANFHDTSNSPNRSKLCKYSTEKKYK